MTPEERAREAMCGDIGRLCDRSGHSDECDYGTKRISQLVREAVEAEREVVAKVAVERIALWQRQPKGSDAHNAEAYARWLEAEWFFEQIRARQQGEG